MLNTWFKKIALSLVGAGSSLIIAACYGVRYGGEIVQLVSGRVTGNNQPVAGIKVCADLPGQVPNQHCTYTYQDGTYSIEVYEIDAETANIEGFRVTTEDVDGPANGAWEPEEVDVPTGSVPADIDVALTEDASS